MKGHFVRLMLSKKFRLTKRGSFAYVYRKGKSVRGRYISLIFTAGRDCPRVGFSVNNKIGHAVVRNKLKRRMRAVMATFLPKMSACQAVFVTRPGAGEMNYDAILADMTALLDKSGLLRSENEKKEN